MVTNLLLRIVHIELLSSYSTKDILDLIRMDSRFPSNLLDSIWFEEGVFEREQHRIYLDALTEWLFSRGINPEQFIENMFSRFTSSEYMSSRIILRSYLPFVPKFYETDDVRRLSLETLPDRQSLIEGAQVIFNDPVENVRNDIMIYRCEEKDKLASHYMPWIEALVRYAPAFLTCPPYESIQTLCFQNTVAEVLAKHNMPILIDNKTVLLHGRVIGHVVPFSEAIEKYGLSWSNTQETSIPCIRIDEDVTESGSGAVLLKRGAYYGAPANIVKISYQAGVTHPDPFAKLMSSLVRQEFDVWQPVQKAHEALLNAANDSVVITYYKSDDSISVNDHHLMRNVPARILRNLLREYTATGREEYENREFKRDPEICMDPLRPNFESRLNRVVAHVEKVSKYFEIQRHRRGGFRFKPNCRIVFKEE
ncbi:MAG TPA: hypothetical protein PLT31_04455 [Fibrobacteraceae bacterium]|nr:hypothetical protein [Fibrobacteraceae bacterium]